MLHGRLMPAMSPRLHPSGAPLLPRMMISAYSRRDLPSLEVQTVLVAYIEAPDESGLVQNAAAVATTALDLAVEAMPGGEAKLVDAASKKVTLRSKGRALRRDTLSTRQNTRIVSLCQESACEKCTAPKPNSRA